jgi:hypothetical protein
MADFDELTWQEAMRRGHAALLDSEHLYDDINASEGRSNLDIEKHLRRSEVRPPRPASGSRWPTSLAARATATATRAPDRDLQVQQADRPGAFSRSAARTGRWPGSGRRPRR